MKYQKIISFVVALTVVMALLAMPAHAALIIDNGAVSKTSTTAVSDYNADFGDVVECNKFGATGIYNMYLTGNPYSGGTTGPYRMFVSKDFEKISTSDLSEKYFVGTAYIALDESNYMNAFPTNGNPGIHIGLMADGKAWYSARQTINLANFVEADYIYTDRLAKLDVVVTASTSANKLNFKFYLNNKLNSTADYNIQGSRTNFTEFVISMQAPYTYDPEPVNIYAGNMSCKTVAAADGYTPNNGTGAVTSTGALAEYAPGFTPGKNFYVPAGTTVADILEMESTYKTFELRSEDGTVITEASEDSAVGCYIYSVGEGNNTDDMGLYSKICEYVPTTLVKDQEAKTFTASGIADGKAGSLIVAQFDQTGEQLTKVLYVSEINESGYYEKAYTVENYDSASIYRAFLWKMPEMTPIVSFEEF